MRHVTDLRTASDYHISEEQFDSSCILFMQGITVICITVYKDREWTNMTLSHMISLFPHTKGSVPVCGTKNVAMLHNRKLLRCKAQMRNLTHSLP